MINAIVEPAFSAMRSSPSEGCVYSPPVRSSPPKGPGPAVSVTWAMMYWMEQGYSLIGAIEQIMKGVAIIIPPKPITSVKARKQFYDAMTLFEMSTSESDTVLKKCLIDIAKKKFKSAYDEFSRSA
jgi:hypothetical protein